ncbi:MAG: hypothetical protein K2X93_19325 [Candidatus Obscuribacterales bacterium]|nr:hypothetical protein [Candidatus Obscuribacterales bacterium]
MTHNTLYKTEVPATTIPCVVLASLQSDLASIMKSKALLPFRRMYVLSPDSFVELSIQKLESGQFQLEINAPNRREHVVDPKLKKLVDTAHMFTWLALSTSLSRSSLAPCPSMAHSGADEVLALYQCLGAFKGDSDRPYSSTITGPRGSYELFTVTQKGGMSELVIETNCIYGNSMKWKAEVEFTHQLVERAGKIISDVLGEWLRPGGISLRREYDRETNLTRH